MQVQTNLHQRMLTFTASKFKVQSSKNIFIEDLFCYWYHKNTLL